MFCFQLARKLVNGIILLWLRMYYLQMDLHLDPNNQLGCPLIKRKITTQECLFAFLGCKFTATASEIEKHLEEYMKYHLCLVGDYLSDRKVNGVNKSSANNEAVKNLLYSEIHKINETVQKVKVKDKTQTTQLTELQGKQKDISFRLTGVEDILSVLQENITEINRTYAEVSLTLQTLQATSYDGKYIWKIPDITRRRRDALMGKTVSLYSAPFYTDRFGYRMCLRVYLDGDGSGKGHYISYFLTIMKGEYDALLEWPFQLTVTLTMINQKGNGNIVQSFKPNPNSASFHRPKADMNVASGCPKYAPLSVLDNPEFIVDDTAYFKCMVNCSVK